ncbi:MAG: CAP domain-containing protein [Patescibacteria group bacterium]
MAKKLRSHIHDHLIPHQGNGFKPLLFTATGIGAVIVVLLLVQAAYFVQTKIVFTKTDFLASVLPGVLATLTNQDRAANGIASLSVDPHLSQAAQMKANDMAARGYFSHVDPDGNQPWFWFKKAGYDYAYAGENLAVNFTDSEDVQKAWMNSPTHHANIVKAQYTRIGIGVAQGMYEGKETIFVVQFFATPRLATAPVKAVAAEPVAVSAEQAPVEGEPADTQVLGVEVGTVVPDEPGEEAMFETEYESSQPGMVQGESIDPALSFFAQVAASPTHTVIYILAGLAALIAILLLVAIGVHIKVQYLEVVGGGLILLLVALSLLVFNATNESEVQVPVGEQPAASVGAF